MKHMIYKTVLLLAALVSPLALAQYDVVVGTATYGSLADSHGQKIATGRYNTLHTIYEYGQLIKYATSADGDTWTSPVAVNNGSSPGIYPAISVDSYGTVAVVWAANVGSNDLGQIWYAWKTLTGSWQRQKIVNSGTQPAITSSGKTVYITWTNFTSVQYTSFQTDTPPAAINFGVELENDGCPNSGYVKPAIAVVRKPCKSPEVRIAYLRYSDEIGSGDPGCATLQTEVGARLCVRDPDTGIWSLEYSNLLTVTNNTNGIEPLSLSLNTNYLYRDVYLAFSDISNLSPRTVIAHGKDGVWNDTIYANQINHIHIAAKKNSSSGVFRIARASNPTYPWDYFASYNDAWYRTGTWSGTGTLSWSEPEQAIHSGGPLIGRPQAHFWGKCSSGNYSEIHSIFELEIACSSPVLASDFSINSGCPSGGITSYPWVDCHRHALSVAMVYNGSGDGEISLDGGELGPLLDYDRNSARFQISKNDFVTISWDQGDVISTTESGLTLSGFSGEIRSQGSVEVEINWDQPITTYKTAKDPDTCEIGREIRREIRR